MGELLFALSQIHQNCFNINQFVCDNHEIHLPASCELKPQPNQMLITKEKGTPASDF